MTPTMPVNQSLFAAPSVSGPDADRKTMSSAEIAQLTGKAHSHVLRDIRVMIEGLGGQSNFGSTYQDAQGKTRACFNLPRRECLILVSGYSIEIRARIIDRWEELERAARAPAIDLNNPADLRMLLVNYADDKIEQQAKIASMETTVAAFNQIADASGSMCGTDAGKHLGIGRKALFAFMRQNRWLYRRPGTNYDLAYQDKIEAGLLEHKVTTVHSPDGTERIHTQARITPKGLAKLAKLIPPTVRLVTGAA